MTIYSLEMTEWTAGTLTLHSVIQVWATAELCAVAMRTRALEYVNGYRSARQVGESDSHVRIETPAAERACEYRVIPRRVLGFIK